MNGEMPNFLPWPAPTCQQWRSSLPSRRYKDSSKDLELCQGQHLETELQQDSSQVTQSPDCEARDSAKLLHVIPQNSCKCRWNFLIVLVSNSYIWTESKGSIHIASFLLFRHSWAKMAAQIPSWLFFFGLCLWSDSWVMDTSRSSSHEEDSEEVSTTNVLRLIYTITSTQILLTRIYSHDHT